jgi:FtsH-binding integral membrane protein
VNFTLVAMLLTAALFAGMLLTSEIGRRVGVKRLVNDPEGLTKGAGAAEGAVFGLLGLLLAFTFSGAASRFEDRKWFINTEANAIGTAYLRIDLLPAETQAPLRDLFRRYTTLRATIYQNAHNQDEVIAGLAHGTTLQNEIWKQAMAAMRLPGASPQATMLLTPALNEMIDITSTRQMATRNHPPNVIFMLLAMLALIGALLVGYGTSTNKDRSWFHQVTFALVISLAIYVIVDLEYPRLGLIKVDSADQALIDVVDSMR